MQTNKSLLRVALPLLLLLTGCQSTPSMCDCKDDLIDGLADGLKQLTDGKEVDMKETSELLKACEEAYGDLSLQAKLEKLQECGE